MEKMGLLIDYQWCTGCHSCEVACQMEHGLPVGQFGIKVNQVGPWKYESRWQFDNIPTPTDQCDLCAERVSVGQQPTCVHHCQAKCMEYGPASSFIERLGKGSKIAFFAV